MKRKILIAIYIILILLTIKLFYNIVANSVLINKYNNGQYSESQAKLLTYINFPQGYVANYNYGNILYKNEEYDKAIEKYEKALKGIVPKDKECDIRINYALSICQTVQVNEQDQKSIEEAIKTYESAIDILTEKGCANKEDNNGHNKKAEKLKKDIQEEINRLKKLQNNPKNNNENNKEEASEKTEETETIETKIQNIKENATKEQREGENMYKNFNKGLTKKGKNW